MLTGVRQKIKMGSWKHAVLRAPPSVLCGFPILELSIFVSPYAPPSAGVEQSLGYG